MIVGATLGGKDNVSIQFLSGWSNGLFIAPGMGQDVAAFLVERYFENGAALFGRESSDEMQDFRNAAVVDWNDEETYRVIQYYVQRVRNYGHIESLYQAGFEQARVVSHSWPEKYVHHFQNGETVTAYEVARTCHQEKDCNLLDIFSIYHRLQWIKGLSFDDYERKVYGRDLGFPPFNIECACSLEGYFAYLD